MMDGKDRLLLKKILENSQLMSITRFGAYGVIIQNSKLLLTEKKSGPYKDLWGLPGGAIEFGESPEDALKREVQEEAALQANELQLLTVLTRNGKYLDNQKTYNFHHVGIIYKVNAVSRIEDSLPLERIKWMAYDEIALEELTPFAQHIWSETIKNPKH